MSKRHTGSAEGQYVRAVGKPDLDKKAMVAALARGVAVVHLDACHCDWTRQAFINEVMRQAGGSENGKTSRT